MERVRGTAERIGRERKEERNLVVSTGRQQLGSTSEVREVGHFLIVLLKTLETRARQQIIPATRKMVNRHP